MSDISRVASATDPSTGSARPAIDPGTGNGQTRLERSQVLAAFGLPESGQPEPSEGFTGTLNQLPGARTGLALLAAQGFAHALPVVAIVVVGPQIGTAFGTTPGIGIVLAVVGTLMAAALAVPVAVLAHRRLRRDALLVAAGVGWSVALALAALSGSVAELLLLALVVGGTAATVHVLHGPMVFDFCPPGTRVQGIAIHRAAILLGVGVGAAVASASHVNGQTWRATLLILSGLSLLSVVAGVALRDPGVGSLDRARLREALDEEGTEPRDSAEEESEARLGGLESLRRATAVPLVRRSLGLFVVAGMLLLPLYVFLLSALEWRWALDVDVRAAIVALGAVGGAVLLVVLGPAGERRYKSDPGRILSDAGTLGAIGVVGLGLGILVPSLPVMIVLVVAGVAATSVLLPSLVAAVLMVTPANVRTHACAVTSTMALALGTLVGLVYLNSLGQRFGDDIAVAGLVLPGAIAVIGMRRLGRDMLAELENRVHEAAETVALRRQAREGRRAPLLACHGIDFSYGQLQVLFDVDFTVEEGQIVTLLGTNGAGKSTLLRAISGLSKPDRGTVRLDGVDITHLDAERRLSLGISQIPGGRAVFDPMTVIENLRVFGHALGRDRRRIERGIEQTLATFPRLGERRNQYAGTLSGGEQQMLALGKAFLLQPRVLLIDELSLGLAPKVVGELLEMVRGINAEGTAVVLVEQSVNIALTLASHAYFMEKGEIRFDGPAGQLLEEGELLRSVFLEGAAEALGTGEDPTGSGGP